MKTRIARLALVGGLAVTVLAPIAPAAHAMTCAPDEIGDACRVVFGTWGAACTKVPDSSKYPIHELLCPQLG